jgi:uncharacterized membrane protein
MANADGNWSYEADYGPDPESRGIAPPAPDLRTSGGTRAWTAGRPAPSTAAIGGHPVHPMLVPYPIALLSAAAACDLAARLTGDPFWVRASRLYLYGGLVMGAAAATAGATDFATIKRARRLPEGRWHAFGNALAMALTGLNICLRRHGTREVSRTEALLSAAVAGILGVTGWLGAELSYRHRIGVTPDQR